MFRRTFVLACLLILPGCWSRDRAPAPDISGRQISVDDLQPSPYNWSRTGTAMIAVNPGAYFKINFTGTSARFTVDTSTIYGAGVSAKRNPRIRWSIDAGAYQTYQLLSGDTQASLATGLAAGTHQLVCTFLASDAYTNRWDGTMALKITNFLVDAGASVSAPTLRPGRLIAYGDSITEGAWDLGGPADTTNYSNYEDSTASWLPAVAQALDCEYGSCAFGGQAWETAGGAGLPALTDTWNFIYSGHARTFTPAPDYVLCNMGANGGVSASATVTTWITNVRTAVGASARIILIVPFGGSGRTNITAGFNAYTVANPSDAKVHLIDLGTIPGIPASSGAATFQTTDGLHPDVQGHARLGAMVARQIQAAIGSGGVRRVAFNGGF